MLDDLRNSATTPSEPHSEPPFVEDRPARRKSQFLGMSAGQRFVLALLIFMMTCVMGVGCLVLTGKVYLPFF